MVEFESRSFFFFLFCSSRMTFCKNQVMKRQLNKGARCTDTLHISREEDHCIYKSGKRRRTFAFRKSLKNLVR